MTEIRKNIVDVDEIIKRNVIEPPLDLSLIKHFDNQLIITYFFALGKNHMLVILHSNKKTIDKNNYLLLLSKIDSIYEILEKI